MCDILNFVRWAWNSRSFTSCTMCPMSRLSLFRALMFFSKAATRSSYARSVFRASCRRSLSSPIESTAAFKSLSFSLRRSSSSCTETGFGGGAGFTTLADLLRASWASIASQAAFTSWLWDVSLSRPVTRSGICALTIRMDSRRFPSIDAASSLPINFWRSFIYLRTSSSWLASESNCSWTTDSFW